MKAASHSEVIAKLVERQMRNWELARHQRRSEVSAGPPELADFIAISRLVGVDGAKVASMLGERLGWPVWDKKILDVMANNDNLRRQIYTSIDERNLNLLEEALRSAAQPEFIRNDYFHILKKTVLALARQSCAVFVGRGADQILPRDRGLRVRLAGPLEWRLRQFIERTGLPPVEAAARLRQIDRERDEFIWRHFGVAADDPARYDLTLNLATIPSDQAVELIIAARAAATVGRGPA